MDDYERDRYNDRQIEIQRDDWLNPLPDEPDPVRYCEYCGAPMYVGETLWKIGFDYICEDCARNEFSEVIRDDD